MLKLSTSAVSQSLVLLLQGSVGEADSEQASPMGSPHHLHRADQESCLQVLEPRLCALCPWDWKVGFVFWIVSLFVIITSSAVL